MHLGSAPLTAAGLGLAALLLSACGAGHDDPRAGATLRPAEGQCNDMPGLHGEDPMGIALGTNWASDHHAWGDRVTVYTCDDPLAARGFEGLRAAGSDVVVSPNQQRRRSGYNGIYAFDVTVNLGARGTLYAQIISPSGQVASEMDGPTIEPDGDGWHFVKDTA